MDKKEDKKDSKKQVALVKNTIELNPKLNEAKSDVGVFTWGRMNPMTIGHEKLVDKVIAVAKQNAAMPHVYLTHSFDSKKNPLPYKTKIRLAKKAFGNIVTESRAKTIMQAMQELQGMHKKIILVVGSDRVNEFKTLLTKYNGKDYNFESIEVVSAGERDPDADDVSGMSASKMRELAADNNVEEFKKGLPRKLQSSAQRIIDNVRDGMQIAEELEAEGLLSEVLTLAQRRKRAMAIRRSKAKIRRGRLIAQRKLAPKEKLQKRSRRMAIRFIRKRVAGEKGKSYASLSPGEKARIDSLVQKRKAAISTIAKRLMPKVQKAERERLRAFMSSKKEELYVDAFDIIFENWLNEVSQDKDIKDREGTQPAKYHKGLAKSTKAKRDAQFQKQGEMDSGDPNAYKDAPGDSKETKPSKYTKRFHQMFGKEQNMKFDKRFRFNQKVSVTEDQLFHIIDEMFEYYENEKLNENAEAGLQKKAEKSGISYSILKKVYDRGMAAWKSGHRPGATQQQWGYARVNSFITGGKTRTTADADLWRQHKESLDADFENFLGEETSIYTKTAAKAKNKEGTVYAFGREKSLDGLPKEKGGYAVFKLASNYDGQVRGGIRKSWVLVQKGLSYEEAVKLMNKRLKYKGFNESIDEDIAIQLERDKDQYVLHMKEVGKKGAPRSVPKGRVELRGKANYEGNGYDPKDKLHKFLDAVGKGVNMSDLMNGNVAVLSDKNPRAQKGLEAAKKLMGESTEDHRKDYETFAKMYTQLNKAIDDAKVELKKFDHLRGPTGMTPDNVKSSPEYKKAKANYEKASNLTKRFLKGVPSAFLKKYSQSKRLRREEVELYESVPKDDLNFVATGGAFGKKRRFPTFVVKKEGIKYKAYDEQDKMNLKASSNSLKGLASMLKPYIEKRIGGTWKLEEDTEHDKCDTATQNLDEAFTAAFGVTMFANDFEELKVHGGFQLHPSVDEIDEDDEE